MAMKSDELDIIMTVYPDGSVVDHRKAPCWYNNGWIDYEKRFPMGQGLWAMHEDGESGIARDDYKRGWRDAMIVDLADMANAPKWMKDWMGI